MKKIKYLASLIVVGSVLFTGCASSFQEAIGNVTQENLERNSYMTYKNNIISDDIGKMMLLLDQFKIESSTLQATPNKLYDGTLWTKDLSENTKKGVIENTKIALALSAHAKEYGVKLDKKDEIGIERAVKTQLGQKYRNMMVDFFEAHGLNLNEQLLTEYIKLNTVADKVKEEMLKKAKAKKDVGKTVEYDQMVVNISSTEEGAKDLADKIKDEVSGGKDFDSVSKEYGVVKLDGIEIQDVPSQSLSQDLHDAILKMKKDEVRVFEEKAKGKIVAYYVIKVKDIDSENAKNKARSIQDPSLKASEVKKVVEGWLKDIKVNNEKYNKFQFKIVKSFWEMYDDNKLLD